MMYNIVYSDTISGVRKRICGGYRRKRFSFSHLREAAPGHGQGCMYSGIKHGNKGALA